MKDRVLQVIPSLELGGTEAYVMNNYRYIDKENIHFDFLIFTDKEGPYAQEIRSLGGNIYYGVQPAFKNFFKFLKILKTVTQNGNSYKAIHCHANTGNALPLCCAAICGIKKRISHCHAICGSKNLLGRLKFFLRRTSINLFATEYLACSTEAGNSLYGKNIFIKKGKVINNAIDIDKFIYIDEERVERLRAEFKIEKNKKILGNISRFDNCKNQTFILEVFNELLKINPEMLLVLGGVNGGMLEAVKNKAKELDLQDKVIFIGPRNDVADCLHLIDVYVFPSVSEGFGISFLEAQAAGCLCFASTGVPQKTDMGLGLANYYSLQTGSKKWAENILIKLDEFSKVDAEIIKEAFDEKGFSIKENIKQLEGVYYKK